MKKKLLFLKNNPQEILHREKVNERLRFAAAHDVNTVLKYLGTTGKGLPSGMVEQARERYGDNVVTHGQKESLFTRICKAFINPFTAILFVLAAVSASPTPAGPRTGFRTTPTPIPTTPNRRT